MDLNVLRDGVNAAVPFNRHVGIDIFEVQAGRCRAQLPARDELRNHVGGQHATTCWVITILDSARRR
jgi:acyl-coenzyme A thioesterase PaaI-like protein